MVLIVFLEFAYLQACGSSIVKKKVEVGSDDTLAKGMKLMMCEHLF